MTTTTTTTTPSTDPLATRQPLAVGDFCTVWPVNPDPYAETDHFSGRIDAVKTRPDGYREVQVDGRWWHEYEVDVWPSHTEPASDDSDGSDGELSVVRVRLADDGRADDLVF